MPTLPTLGHLPAGATRFLYLPGDLWSHPQCPAPGTIAGGTPIWTPSGNLCTQMQFAPDSWTSTGGQVLLAQWVSGGTVFRLELTTDGSLLFRASANGSVTSVAHAISHATLGSPANGSMLTVRAVRQSNNAGATTTAFYISTDYDPLTKTGTWTQKGTTQTTAGATSFFAGSKAPIQLGSANDGTSTVGNNVPATGKFYWANIYDGVDDTGTLVAMIDLRTPWAGSAGTNGFYVDSASNKWTLKGSHAKWDYNDVVNLMTTIQPSVPMSTKAGWCPLSNTPLTNVPTNGGTTWGAGAWKFMPFTCASMSAIKGLAVETSTAASGGTCALQFAIYKADGAGGTPGTLVQDLSGLGTIDLTATAGVHTLTFTALSALANGNYYIGAMWQGTATGNPNLYVAQGNHPLVSLATAARNVNAYTQTTSSVPSPASPSATGSGLIVWYEQ